jgi:hypothetical protein
MLGLYLAGRLLYGKWAKDATEKMSLGGVFRPWLKSISRCNIGEVTCPTRCEPSIERSCEFRRPLGRRPHFSLGPERIGVSIFGSFRRCQELLFGCKSLGILSRHFNRCTAPLVSK